MRRETRENDNESVWREDIRKETNTPGFTEASGRKRYLMNELSSEGKKRRDRTGLREKLKR